MRLAGGLTGASPPPVREAGFTLVEMLVVLTILGLLAAVATARLSVRPAFVDRARVRGALAEAISAARHQALVSGHPVPVDASKLAIHDLAYQPAFGDTQAPLTVFPDGSTSGGIVSIKGRPVVAIDWMTGRVSDALR